MGLLNRYILRQIWWPMLLASVVISFVMIAGAIQGEIKELVKDVPIAQFTAWDISKVSILVLPAMVGLIFPITFLLGILLTFGAMARNSELIAMKAAGIPMRWVVLPIIVAGVVLSGLCFWVQDRGQPWAYRGLSQLVNSDLPLRISLDMLPKGVMHRYGDWRVYIGEKDEEGALVDLVVLSEGEEGVTMTHADKARLIKGKGATYLEMLGVYQIPPGLGETRRMDSINLLVPGLAPRESGSSRKGMTVGELYARDGILAEEFARTGANRTKEALVKLRVEFSERLSFPLMCLAVSVVAAPIGARTRRAGRSFTFASGFVIVALYLVMGKAVEAVVMAKALESAGLFDLGATALLGQLPNLLLCAVGGVLVWRVDRV